MTMCEDVSKTSEVHYTSAVFLMLVPYEKDAKWLKCKNIEMKF